MTAARALALGLSLALGGCCNLFDDEQRDAAPRPPPKIAPRDDVPLGIPDCDAYATAALRCGGKHATAVVMMKDAWRKQLEKGERARVEAACARALTTLHGCDRGLEPE